VTWHLYESEPRPETLADVDAWVDPAASDADLDGFTAEALVLGLPVVATRTPMNAWRLEKGRTGFLVPLNDPNEMTHAILAALFKVEVAENKKNAAKQTVSKFRARQRLRILTSLYEQTIS
jgi:glycosyltransferase involved in cell wall biosynthesis